MYGGGDLLRRGEKNILFGRDKGKIRIEGLDREGDGKEG